MADIDIVPKRRSYAWVWVLLAVILVVALIFALVGRPDTAIGLLQDGQQLVSSGVSPLSSLSVV